MKLTNSDFSFAFSARSDGKPHEIPGFSMVQKTILITFLSSIIIMTILGNLLVMVAVCKDRQLR